MPDATPERIEALRHQCDTALTGLLGATDAVYHAASTLTEVENAVHELADGDTWDPRYAPLATATGLSELLAALNTLQTRLAERQLVEPVS